MEESINVMVEAKKEYTAQLCNILCPLMIETFSEMYNEAVKISKGKKVLVQYQKLLKEVPNWNNHMVSVHNENLKNTCGWFNDLLAAVFVSNVKILSAVRLKSVQKKISIKLPTNHNFVHGCYINAAKNLYKDPYVFSDTMTENDRDEALTKRFVDVIMITIQDMIPVQDILKTYISQDGVLDNVDVESIRGDEFDNEDPDVTEDEEGGVTGPQEAEGSPQEEVPTWENNEQEEEATKEIPVSGDGVNREGLVPSEPEPEDDVLFPNAPDSQKEKPQL